MIDMTRLAASLRLHEGVRLKLYWDSAEPPKATIGVGHNLTDRGISRAISDAILLEDITEAQRECLGLPWFGALNVVRQNVICELVFNMGAPKLAGFVRMIDAIKSQDWERAAKELLDSDWKDDVGPARSHRLAEMLRSGVWP